MKHLMAEKSSSLRYSRRLDPRDVPRRRDVSIPARIILLKGALANREGCDVLKLGKNGLA
jgi:hypothetical protein